MRLLILNYLFLWLLSLFFVGCIVLYGYCIIVKPPLLDMIYVSE